MAGRLEREIRYFIYLQYLAPLGNYITNILLCANEVVIDPTLLYDIRSMFIYSGRMTK
jgi:hypothetical protein